MLSSVGAAAAREETQEGAAVAIAIALRVGCGHEGALPWRAPAPAATAHLRRRLERRQVPRRREPHDAVGLLEPKVTRLNGRTSKGDAQRRACAAGAEVHDVRGQVARVRRALLIHHMVRARASLATGAPKVALAAANGLKGA